MCFVKVNMVAEFKLNKKSIIFDHDETLADNGFKSDGSAFIWTVQKVWPELMDACYFLMEDNSDWRSWNRYEFFRRLLISAGVRNASSFNNNIENDSDVLKLATPFSKIVVEKTIENGLYDGVLETLCLLSKKGLRMYIVSGTTHGDILEIAGKSGVAEYMSGVYGFGWSKNLQGEGLGKNDAYKDILNRDGVLPRYRIVVGDGVSDKRLAKYIGCDFIGIPRKHTNDWGPITNKSGIEKHGDIFLIDSVTRILHIL